MMMINKGLKWHFIFKDKFHFRPLFYNPNVEYKRNSILWKNSIVESIISETLKRVCWQTKQVGRKSLAVGFRYGPISSEPTCVMSWIKDKIHHGDASTSARVISKFLAKKVPCSDMSNKTKGCTSINKYAVWLYDREIFPGSKVGCTSYIDFRINIAVQTNCSGVCLYENHCVLI